MISLNMTHTICVKAITNMAKWHLDNWHFIFLVVPGRLQEKLVLQLRQAQVRLLNSACLGPLSEAPEEEDDVQFTVK